MTESKPKSEPNAVPTGVKLTDEELANGVALKITSAITMCGTGLIQAVRNDVGMMWFEFQTEHVIYGANLKALMRKRGWIKVPPYYYPPGLPNQ
ncbi:DUF3231 family protein [Effusibacillus consociatus]|uniref:DUF3231 family protein n=1 Tax=Effusibacillus consociatus TaxID=1117041 RepID=A0ABV9Q3T8_9BACL